MNQQGEEKPKAKNTDMHEKATQPPQQKTQNKRISELMTGTAMLTIFFTNQAPIPFSTNSIISQSV
jgi:hypothetical protein